MKRLRGMFAFAIWDDWAGDVPSARDSFGIKVLYYSLVAGTLIFASEVERCSPAGHGEDAKQRDSSVTCRTDRSRTRIPLSKAFGVSKQARR